MNDSHLVKPSVYPPADASYTLYVSSTVGCGVASDQVNIKVFDNFHIPNAFTPNDDGRNEMFRVKIFDNYKLTHFRVFNRWGQLVFSAEGPNDGWDGTFKGDPQPGGVYTYHLEIQSPSRKKIIRKGTVLLMR